VRLSGFSELFDRMRGCLSEIVGFGEEGLELGFLVEVREGDFRLLDLLSILLPLRAVREDGVDAEDEGVFELDKERARDGEGTGMLLSDSVRREEGVADDDEEEGVGVSEDGRMEESDESSVGEASMLSESLAVAAEEGKAEGRVRDVALVGERGGF
jgi:hypothetical protein